MVEGINITEHLTHTAGDVAKSIRNNESPIPVIVKSVEKVFEDFANLHPSAIAALLHEAMRDYLTSRAKRKGLTDWPIKHELLMLAGTAAAGVEIANHLPDNKEENAKQVKYHLLPVLFEEGMLDKIGHAVLGRSKHHSTDATAKGTENSAEAQTRAPHEQAFYDTALKLLCKVDEFLAERPGVSAAMTSVAIEQILGNLSGRQNKSDPDHHKFAIGVGALAFFANMHNMDHPGQSQHIFFGYLEKITTEWAIHLTMRVMGQPVSAKLQQFLAPLLPKPDQPSGESRPSV